MRNIRGVFISTTAKDADVADTFLLYLAPTIRA